MTIGMLLPPDFPVTSDFTESVAKLFQNLPLFGGSGKTRTLAKEYLKLALCFRSRLFQTHPGRHIYQQEYPGNEGSHYAVPE